MKSQKNGTQGPWLTDFDLWRLADEFSVVDAAFLIVGHNPGDLELQNPFDPINSRILWQGEPDESDFNQIFYEDSHDHLYENPKRFRAAFKALRQAVVTNRLRARIVNVARRPDYVNQWSDGHSYYRLPHDDGEEERHYGFAVSRGMPSVFSNSDVILNANEPASERVLYILKEPDWQLTTVGAEDLKHFLSEKGLAPKFFFPKGYPEGFRDSDHARYSPKLATAVAAWETVEAAGKGKSVKETLTDWIVSNGVQFGLGNEEGVVSPTVAGEVAKVSNWRMGGGANPTYSEADETEGQVKGPIQNLTEVTDGNLR